MEYILNLMKKNRKMSTCIHTIRTHYKKPTFLMLFSVGLGNTRISKDYGQKFPHILHGTKGEGFVAYGRNSHPSDLTRSPIDLWMIHLHSGF